MVLTMSSDRSSARALRVVSRLFATARHPDDALGDLHARVAGIDCSARAFRVEDGGAERDERVGDRHREHHPVVPSANSSEEDEMAVTIRTTDELGALRAKLIATEKKARVMLEQILQERSSVLRRLKFEKLGCDPFDEHDEQNFAEQIDQQATYEVALDAVAVLMDRHPGRAWALAPGATGSGHDIRSNDGDVAAEVFATVKPTNNDKLKDDIAKVAKFTGKHRYVFFRSPSKPPGEQVINGVCVVSLGM